MALALYNASVAQVEEFFGPLEPSHYLDLNRTLAPAGYRHRLVREKPHLIESFSEELRDQIADSRHLFFRFFQQVRAGDLGPHAAEVCRASRPWQFRRRPIGWTGNCQNRAGHP